MLNIKLKNLTYLIRYIVILKWEIQWKKKISFNIKAKDKLKEDINLKSKILDVGPLNNPFFSKKEADVYYADVKSTEEVKKKYSYLEKNRFDRIVDIDYVIEDSYENTFKNKNIKFDFVIFSHVFEHIPNPIEVLLDISTILTFKGKLCILLPDKEFTFDHYRENTSFADWYDVYVRGEEYSLPKLVLDSMIDSVSLNNPIDYWNNNINEHPHPNTESCLSIYQKFIDKSEKSFEGHHWVFTDRSFLRILENLYKLNLIPYNLISFYPTAKNDNTFGLILELDYSIQESINSRKKIINTIHNITEIIYQKRLELESEEIIEENIKLRDKLNKIININFKNLNYKQTEEYLQIYYSGKFDSNFYINKYKINTDIDPIVHFLKIGSDKGFNPSPNFDTKFYSKFYPDVANNNINPFIHYLTYGEQENRIPKFLTEDEIKKLNISEDNIVNYLTIKYSGDFDEEYYVKKYNLKKNVDPIVHYLEVGADKGFNPSPEFDTKFYLKTNEDVRKTGMNPFIHYLQFGKKELRLPK